MPPKYFGSNFKGKNKLFRHEVHNIRLGVGHTVIGKHTIRLLIDRLTAEETKKIADSTQSNAESVLHMEANDLALTYGSKEFLYLKRQLEPLCLTTAITLHFHQRIAKMLLQALEEHIEADGYFALLNLTMAFARDIGRLFIPYFDLFSKALLRGLYDKETGTRFIAKADRVQLIFTALSSLVIGIGGVVCSSLVGNVARNPEDDLDVTYEGTFIPTIPKVLTDDQRQLLASMRRVIALVVQRTFRDTKEYIRRLGAETLASLCRRHPRLIPDTLSVCSQATLLEVRAARVNPLAAMHDDADKDEEESEDEADQEEQEDEEEDEADDISEDNSDSESGETTPVTVVVDTPVTSAELRRSAVADAIMYLTQNLLTGIRGALATNYENTLISILASLIDLPRSTGSDDERSMTAVESRSLHEIATFIVSGTFSSLIDAVRNDKTNAAIPRILTSLVDQLLPPALTHLEGELNCISPEADSRPQSPKEDTTIASGYVSRYMKVVLAALSAAHHVVLNRAHETEEMKKAADSVTNGVLEILRRVRTLVKPKVAAPHNLPQLYANTLLIAQALVHTDKYSSPPAMKAGEAFVAALLAEAGRILQCVCTTSDKTHILAVAHTLKEYCQDVSQKAAAHLAQYSTRDASEGGLTMPCNDEFSIAVGVVLVAKASNSQLEATFRRELVDIVMILADILRSTLPSASSTTKATAPVPHLLARLVVASVPSAEKGKKGTVAVNSVLQSWMQDDLDTTVAEIAAANDNEVRFLNQLSRAAAWLNLLPSINVAAAKEFEPCITSLGALLEAGRSHQLSAKVRNRILQVYVRGSALLSREASTKGSPATKLSALVKQIAASIPAGFHPQANQQGHASHPLSSEDAESNDTTVSLLLEAFERLRSTVGQDGGDHSHWIDTCIDANIYNDFLFVLLHSLASTKNPSTRLSVLILLRDCYDYQHRRSIASARFTGPSFAVVTSALLKTKDTTAIQTALATDHAVFDLLVRCEMIDPLTDGLDAKTNVLAPIIFDAATTNNYFDRYGGRSDSFMIQLLVRFFFGSVHVKFSPMWSVAVRIISHMVKLELAKGEAHVCELGLWKHLAQPLIVSAVLGNESSATRTAKTDAEVSFEAPITVLTQGFYPLTFDDSQVHASGALISHNLRNRSAEDIRSRPVHELRNGQRLLLSDVGFGVSHTEAHAVSQSTDSTAVSRVFLNMLMAIADSLHHCKPSAGKVLSFPEQLVLRLSESDAGIIHEERDEHGLGLSLPTTTNTKALNQRLEIAILAMSAQFAHNTQSLTSIGASADAMARRKQILEGILLQHVCSKESRLQAAAVEGLRKMGVAPYAQYSEYLFPICGGKLSVADIVGTKKKGAAVDGAPKRLGTANAKSALTFLQSFNLEASVKEEHRIGYLTATLLLCLPTLTATGKAGSGGQSHKKVRDREVLGRKLFALLARVRGDGKEDPLAVVVDLLMERILRLPAQNSTNDRYDLCGHLMSEKLTVARLRRRYEQLNRRLMSALKLLQALIPAVGTRFQEYAEKCFLLLLRMYEISLPSIVAQRAGLVHVKLSTDSGSSIRKIAVSLMKGLIETYPSQIGALILSDASKTELFVSTLEFIFSHAPQTMQTTGARGGTTAPLPPPLEVALALSKNVVLMPLMVVAAEKFILPTIERYFRLTASDSVVLAVLAIVGVVIGHADEHLQAVYVDGSLLATSLRKSFLEPYGNRVFSALHRFVTSTSESVLTEVPTAKKNNAAANRNPMRVSPKIWKDVVLLASALPEYIRGGHVSTETLDANMSQLLEIALNFARSPVCATDRASADMAAEIIETIIRNAPKLHPTIHFRKLVHLFNVVTAPIARTVLCSALKIAVTKVEGMTDLATMLQLQAVARCVTCMNAFAREDADKDASPLGSKRGRKEEEEITTGIDMDAMDFSRYDFELRYHTFHSLTQFFNKACGDKKVTAIGKVNKALAGSRSERKFVGEQDIEIPLTVERPRLTMESAVLIAVNILFYLRDRERTIRTFASESLHALIRYASHYPIFTSQNEDADASNTDLVDPLNQLIRPVLLPAFRRGIVSKDSSARLEYMKGFGGLAQYLPEQFPSLATLYSPNSEANFFSCIASAQHRVRMNALGFLRRKCGQMHQREVLRVFVPFVVTYLKDFAQGKHDMRTEQVSEAKQKGFAESLLLTLAAISAHMPWEGYHRILSLLLKEAQEHDALRAVMLKGIVKVLESFHFLEIDASGEKRIADKVVAWEEEDDDQEGAGAEMEGIDINDPSAALATSALAPSARAERKNIRIMAILEEEVLPQLYSFILSQRKSAKSKDLEGVLNESKKDAKGDKKNEPKASVQLPVAVGILKIIRLFPQKRFDHHVDILLNEIVLKLRTKNDKQRETARNVLFAMMNEAGPQKLRFVVTKLRDNLVHGYQLHVLGYTLVGLLQSMFGYAGEKATVVKQPTEEDTVAELENAEDGESSDDEPDTKNNTTEDDAEEMTTDNAKIADKSKGGPMPHKPILPHTAADEQRIVGKAFRMGGTRRRIFSPSESTVALDSVMSDLFDIFVDDYLGEVGEQKEQTELISTLREVKHNKSLQGFSFLAMHCSGEKVMDMFVTKIRWVLAPPTTKELLKNSTNSAYVMGGNTKYLIGDKKRSADARFVERVRVLAVRVAKALIQNENLSMGTALSTSLTMLNRNNALREAKIAEFESKDGTRRIRGNIDQFTAQKRLTLKEQRDKNYVVDERPDRIDVDFSSHTVLATQNKQKLRVYKGAYAKGMKDSSKSFRNEDQESAVVLDTLDEFNLKFLLLLLKKALGIGRSKPLSKKVEKLVTETNLDDEEPQTNEEGSNELEPLEKEDVTNENLDDYDEMELFERQQRHEDDLGEGRAVKKNTKKVPKVSKAERSLAELFGNEHKGQLTELLVPILNVLQGEGADTVVITAFEVTHALLAINPPLPSVQSSGQVLFDVIADLFDRGGEIKPRAMRVMSALVQHTYFNLSNDQALWLTKVARGELIERTKILTMGLGLLQAVVNKHVELVEVYELIDSVTELMMHRASSAPIRTRCVSIIAKFLTEYRLTMQKLQSHINMYVQNLQFPTVDGRMAMLELIGVLVFRLPQQVLRQECNILFVPLVHCMSESPWAPCQEKAAVVLQSLILNAGVDLVSKTITVWLESDTMRTREYAMQAVAVVLPVIPQLYGVDATESTVDLNDRAERFETMKAATEWVIPELQQAIVYDHPLSKSKQQQIKEEIQKELIAKKTKRGGEAAQNAEMLVNKRIRAEKEMATWTFKFFSLRAVEALIKITPSFCSYFGASDHSPIMEHVAKALITHSHPWVRSAATRVLAIYVKGYAFSMTPYGSLSLKWQRSPSREGAVLPAYLCLPTVSKGGVVTVSASEETANAVVEEAKKACKQLLVAVAASDVRDELHYGFKAIDDPFRVILLDAVASLARIVNVGSLITGTVEAMQSVWSQLTSMIEPIVQGKGVRGYLVRSATLAQLLPRLIKDLPFSHQGTSDATVGFVNRTVDVPLLENIIVPFVGICAESTEQSHSVAEFGLAAIEVLKQVVGQYGSEFEGEPAEVTRGAKKLKKRRTEKEHAGILAAAAEQKTERAAHAAVMLGLNKITDELKEKQRREKIAEMHEKNAKKAAKQENMAAKMASMSHKRTGGKKRSRYAQ